MEIQHRRHMGRGITPRELGGCAPFLHQQVKDDFLESKTWEDLSARSMSNAWLLDTHPSLSEREDRQYQNSSAPIFDTRENCNILQTLQALKCVKD